MFQVAHHRTRQLFTFTQSSGDKLGHRCISTYAGLCLAQLSPMLFEFSARFRYAVASKHWGASRGFALIMGFRSGSSALTVGRRTACCCGLQVCASSLGMYAPFCFLVSGRLWGWCLESFLGGLGPSPTLLAGPSLPKHSAWSARSGGCRSQGCHGYPTRSAPVLEAPPSFQAPSPSSSIVDEFKCG